VEGKMGERRTEASSKLRRGVIVSTNFENSLFGVST